MKVNVGVFGFFDRKTIKRHLKIRIRNDATFEDVLKKVKEEVGIDFLGLAKETQRSPVIMINGQRVEMMKELLKKIVEGDEVTIIQPIGGG